MASVSPGYSFTSASDPITYTKLNLVGQPTVTIGAAEVTGSMIAANQSVNGIAMAADYSFIGSTSTETFSGTISLTTNNTKANTRLIACTSNTACTITPTTGGTAGQHLWLRFSTDATGGNVITYASPFKSTGTHTLTGANSKFTAHFVSDGTNWCEVSRTSALS